MTPTDPVTGAVSFKDAANGDYRLGSGSPCINAGLGLGEMDGWTDLAGRGRVKHTTRGGRREVDVGWCESKWFGPLAIRLR